MLSAYEYLMFHFTPISSNSGKIHEKATMKKATRVIEMPSQLCIYKPFFVSVIEFADKHLGFFCDVVLRLVMPSPNLMCSSNFCLFMIPQQTKLFSTQDIFPVEFMQSGVSKQQESRSKRRGKITFYYPLFHFTLYVSILVVYHEQEYIIIQQQ